MKFLIAGLGSIGRRHLRNLLALGEQDIILYRTHQSTLPDAELADFPVETDLRTALAHQPDAVIVSNPTALHLDVAIPAAQAGCHLLIEKPVSHSLERIADLQAAVEQGGGQVLVGYHFRYHPGLQKISELLAQNAIGRPLSVRAHWGEYLPDWHPWEDYRQGYSARTDLGGGVILTLSHPLDYLHWLFGEVGSLWAFADRLNNLGLDVEDTAEIGIKFTSGVMGSIHLDYNQRPPAHHLEIIGTQGTAGWDNTSQVVSLYRAIDPTESRAEGKNTVYETFLPPPGFERNDLFLAEMQHFLDVIRQQAVPCCTLQDGLNALHLAFGALESATTGTLLHFE